MMRNSRKNILITGGLGFIGLTLAELLLKHGYFVTLYDNLNPQIHGIIPRIKHPVVKHSKVTVIRDSVTNANSLELLLAESDIVVHLAAETGTAQSMYQIAHYNNINSQGTAILLDLLANNKHRVTKLILSSSRSIYGEGAYQCTRCGIVHPSSRSAEMLRAHLWDPQCPSCSGEICAVATPEKTNAEPSSIYAATKISQENLVRIVCDSIGIGYVILRFQNVYGERQSISNPYTGVLSIFSTLIRKSLQIPIFEDGLESRDFIHVGDVVSAIQLCMEDDRADNMTFNVGSGVGTTVMDIARLLSSILKSDIQPVVTGNFRLGDIRHCFADTKLIASTLGFNAKISLESGIERFTHWAMKQPLPKININIANEELNRRKMMG